MRFDSTSFITLGLAAWMGGSAPAAEDAQRPDDRIDLKQSGAYAFPQDKAKVFIDNDDLRVSAFTDGAHLYVQAILWKDNSDELGETSDGRTIGDNASLCIDADANGEVTANVDRVYHLNPWPQLPGLRYSILMGGGASTGIQTDSLGSGATRYVTNTTGDTVRVDSFLIPLSAIDRTTGEKIRFAYWGSSTKPELVVNSVGYARDDDKKYWSHNLPHDKYHELELTAGDLVIMPSAVPDGRQDDVPDAAKPEPLAKMPKVGETPPDLIAEDWINIEKLDVGENGGALNLEKLRGKVVVVEFWATWCGPCIAGIPHLNELHEKYFDDGLRIVSFTDQTRKHVEQWMKDANKSMHYALGTGSPLSRRYGVTGIPHAFIISREGKLLWQGHPAVKEFDAEIAKALNTKDAG